MNTFYNKDLLGLLAKKREEIEFVLEAADNVRPIAEKRENSNILIEKTMASLFYQTSTRTRLSFEGAMNRMGGSVIGFSDPKQTRASEESFYAESLNGRFPRASALSSRFRLLL